MDSALLMAEYGVIGTLLYHPDLVGEAMSVLLPDDFSQMGAQGLYQAMCSLFVSGAPVDKVTVLAKAGDDYGPMLEHVLMWDEPDRLRYYCGIVAETAKLERVHRLAESIAESKTVASAAAFVDKLNGLMVSRHQVEVTSAFQAAQDFLERMESEQTPEYLKLGLPPLDQRLFIERGDLVVLGGYPSAGKTLLSVQFAEHLAHTYRVGYYSLETKTKKLVDRLMAYKSKVPLSKIKKHQLNDEDWTAISAAAVEVAKLKFDSVNASGMSVTDIQSVARSHRHEVVFVDYLQLVSEAGRSRYDAVTNISKAFHQMSQDNNVTVIALAQLARPEVDKKSGCLLPPHMGSFKESGQIEQDADVALLLWPEDYNDYQSARTLKIGKNKEGRKGSFRLIFDGDRQRMEPEAPTMQTASNYVDVGRKVRAENARKAKEALAQVSFTDLPQDTAVPF